MLFRSPSLRGALVPVSLAGPRVMVSVGAKRVDEGLWIVGASGGVDSAGASIGWGEAGTAGGRGTSGAALAPLEGVTAGATAAPTGVSVDAATSNGTRVTTATGVLSRAIRGRSAEASVVSCRSLVATTGRTRST